MTDTTKMTDEEKVKYISDRLEEAERLLQPINAILVEIEQLSLDIRGISIHRNWYSDITINDFVELDYNPTRMTPPDTTVLEWHSSTQLGDC